MENLEVVQKRHWIFLTGLSFKTEPKDVLTFLQKHQLEKGCVCEKLTTKSKAIGSFKIGVPKDKKDDLMNPQLWPQGVSVNHFLNLQGRQGSRDIALRMTH